MVGIVAGGGSTQMGASCPLVDSSTCVVDAAAVISDPSGVADPEDLNGSV